jgi:hypothetical protein
MNKRIKNELLNIIKNKFWKDKFSMFILLTNIFFNISIWLFLIFKLKPSEYPVPLHFNIYFGIDVIDKWTQAFMVPSIGLVVILINLVLSYLVFSKEKFIAQFLLASSLFVQVLLFLAGISIVVIR